MLNEEDARDSAYPGLGGLFSFLLSAASREVSSSVEVTPLAITGGFLPNGLRKGGMMRKGSNGNF